MGIHDFFRAKEAEPTPMTYEEEVEEDEYEEDYGYNETATTSLMGSGMPVITGVIALVTAVIGLVIVDSVITGFVGTVNATATNNVTTVMQRDLVMIIAENITTLTAISILSLAGMWFYME